MLQAAHALYWAALVASACATPAYAAAVVTGRTWPSRLGLAALLAGLAALTAALALRWAAAGHGPYLGRYEACASYAWVLLGAFAVLQRRVASLRTGGVLVAPAAFLLLGVGALAPSAPQFASPAMRSAWLWLHVGMAKLALATLVLAASACLVYLRRERGATVAAGVPAGGAREEERAPGARGDVQDLSVRLTSVGFLMLAVVIGSGALWANSVWGSYWSWDPVETWALATWVVYGVALHFNRLWGVAGRRWAWMNLGSLGLSVLLFLVMRLLTLSPHWIYTQ